MQDQASEGESTRTCEKETYGTQVFCSTVFEFRPSEG
jgi:hypothetical protein